MHPSSSRRIGLSSTQVAGLSEKSYIKKEKWEWYEPPEHSLPVHFCLDTSIHGLKFLGQSRRHLFERIFWLAAFVVTTITAVVLIWGLWDTYWKIPIITLFNPIELRIDEIPFPAVTVCNVNNVRKSYVKYYQRQVEMAANDEFSEEEKYRLLARITDMNHICESATTFTERFLPRESLVRTLDPKVLENIRKHRPDFGQYVNPQKTLREGSQPCSEMILFCLWLDEIYNCTHLFQEIDTDYGYCCTFNTIPMQLLLRYGKEEGGFDEERVRQWIDSKLTAENLLFNQESFNRTFPRRQKYPGRPAGLSIFLDPDLDEYYCSNTDSEGFVVALNSPLDFPRMKNKGIAVRTSSEVFVSVTPSVTLFHESIRSFSLKYRQCYFGGEKVLEHFTKYTTSNCIAECIAFRTKEECKCVRYYMPGGHIRDNLCRPRDYNCTEKVRKEMIQSGLRKVCKNCLAPCTEIEYKTETTSLPIRDAYIDTLFDHYPEFKRPRNASIMHVFIDVDSIYPKIRKELTSKTELISNAGGLLGLCMGFSVLSLLEILYYCSVRVACRCYRKKNRL